VYGSTFSYLRLRSIFYFRIFRLPRIATLTPYRFSTETTKITITTPHCSPPNSKSTSSLRAKNSRALSFLKTLLPVRLFHSLTKFFNFHVSLVSTATYKHLIYWSFPPHFHITRVSLLPNFYTRPINFLPILCSRPCLPRRSLYPPLLLTRSLPHLYLSPTSYCSLGSRLQIYYCDPITVWSKPVIKKNKQNLDSIFPSFEIFIRTIWRLRNLNRIRSLDLRHCFSDI